MKTILTYTDGARGSDHRLSAAVELSGRLDAHLPVLACGFELDIGYAGPLGGAAPLPPGLGGAEPEEAAGKGRDLIARAGVRGDVPVVCTWGRFRRELGEAAQFADLVVLGRLHGSGAAYGHSRFRECLVGGARRDFLADFPAPVLTGP